MIEFLPDGCCQHKAIHRANVSEENSALAECPCIWRQKNAILRPGSVNYNEMLVKTRLPKTLLWVINLLMIYVLMFTLFRLAMLVAFKPDDEQWATILPSFWLGLRFDLRWISLLLLPIVLLSHVENLSPFYSNKNRKWWTWYLALVTFVVIFFFAADFGCFSYNKTRLNASALNFAEDPGTSAKMMWESYPIVWMVLALLAAVFCLRWIFRQTHKRVISRTEGLGIAYKRRWFMAASLALVFFAYGSVTTEPLKWKDSFTMGDSFRSYLALNPLQSFFTTLKFRKPEKNESVARNFFPVMKNLMALPNEGFSYSRYSPVLADAIKTRPNVVLVLCESFSMYKSSMSGNPLNTTPFFNSMAANGVFFERCFSPHFSTARGLFATVTGIPDVQLSKFSTRNEQALNQHTIINDFQGYKKYYFLGGDPAFNNFSGLLKNIDGLEMVTEGKFSSQPINVWGISDKDLFLEANKRFAQQHEPFFAIVQTADNHRPFNIPEGEKEFQKKTVSPDSLKKYGFETVNEYNAFRYADFCFQKFIEAASHEHYFNNTIFVFVGDHGVSGNANAVYGDVWTKERLTDEHVPLLFYAPKLLPAQRRKEVVSQIDVLPTVAAISGQAYNNTTLGRDVIHNANGNHYAFIIHHDEGRIGIVTDNFYFTRNLNFNQEELHWFNSNNYSAAQCDSIKKNMSTVTTAFYETAKWMLLNNKKTADEDAPVRIASRYP
jgi:phosphoglycerol transferase MdoB-like AlkP superfamily enzyme